MHKNPLNIILKENKMIADKLQWHPAFTAALRIELEENINDLDFKDEYTLSKKPMLMDVLIIKKNRDTIIKKNIGHIFRTYNIIEYKPPNDSLSINDFYKVYGYTCFYQSNTTAIKEIDPEEITITFVCGRYPHKMLKHLKKVRNIDIEKYDDGIYYLRGDAFPIQILITPLLSKEGNYWMQNLRDDLQSGEEIQNLIKNYDQNKYSKNHQAVMDLIVRANWEKIKEETKMCEALKELFADELKSSQNEGAAKKLIQMVCKKLAKNKLPADIAEDLEEDPALITQICEAASHFAPDYDCDKIYNHMNA